MDFGRDKVKASRGNAAVTGLSMGDTKIFKPPARPPGSTEASRPGGAPTPAGTVPRLPGSVPRGAQAPATRPWPPVGTPSSGSGAAARAATAPAGSPGAPSAPPPGRSSGATTGSRPHASPNTVPPGPDPASSRTPTQARTPSPGDSKPTGRVVHDERGNAVWDWLKETSRIAIESTSRLLRKLEAPELQVEDKKDEELRLEPDRGGGYDPYNQVSGPRRTPRK
jgi:hypothetical protein